MSSQKATENDTSTELRTNRDQKNLRLGEGARDKLEQIAQERYGSRKKQGHVVEDLVEQYLDEDGSMQSKIDDIHAHLLGGATRSRPLSSHTQENRETPSGQSESEEELSEAEELIQKVEDGEPIDTEELSILKGERGVNRIAAVAHAIDCNESTPIEIEDIRNLVKDNMGYGYNTANTIANDVVRRELKPVIDSEWFNGMIEEDIAEEMGKVVNKNDWEMKRDHASADGYIPIDFQDLTDSYIDAYCIDNGDAEMFISSIVRKIQSKYEEYGPYKKYRADRSLNAITSNSPVDIDD